jgi:hypothetical protein
MVTSRVPEKLLSKEDAGRIFAFTKAEWDTAAPTFIPGDWDISFAKHNTGLHVIGFDRSTGFGFSLQPLYENDTGPPRMIIIGNYFPSGALPSMTPEQKRDMEIVAIDALAPVYKVKANTTTKAMSAGNYDVVEFMVTIAVC